MDREDEAAYRLLMADKPAPGHEIDPERAEQAAAVIGDDRRPVVVLDDENGWIQ